MLREQGMMTAHFLRTFRDPVKILDMFAEGPIEYVVERYLTLP
jgi:hypothetical protein